MSTYRSLNLLLRSNILRSRVLQSLGVFKNNSHSYSSLRTSVPRSFSALAAQDTSGSCPSEDSTQAQGEVEPFTSHWPKQPMNSDFTEEDLELTDREVWTIKPAITTPKFTFAAFANDSENIKRLVQLGIPIYRWELMPDVATFILKCKFKRDIIPKLKFLYNLGLETEAVKHVITENPHLLMEDIENLQTRIQYLESKKFGQNAIRTIIQDAPEWLKLSVKEIDNRLGFYQQYFELSGDQVRQLAVRGARFVAITREGRIKDHCIFMHEMMGFERKEIRKMVLDTPEVFGKLDAEKLQLRFHYLHTVMGFSHKTLIAFPKVFLKPEWKLKERFDYLKLRKRDQFDPTKPNYVSPYDISEREDDDFAVNVAKSSVLDFNEFLKSI